MAEENFTMPNLFAGLIGAIVEDKSLDESLKDVGLSEALVFKQLISSHSSDVAKDYVREIVSEQLGKISRKKDSILYLVKKVLCTKNDYKEIAKAVSKEHTDKFQVLRLIGSNREVLKYKRQEPGLEAYLVSGKNPMEAMRKTTSEAPIFYRYMTYFDANSAKKFDELVTNALYKHTLESVEKIFNLIETTF